MTNETAAPPTLDILVVSPHPDDAELGMAGTIMKCREEGLHVGILDLTNGEPTPFGSPEIRRQETAAATEILGIRWRENLGLPNRSLEPTLAARATGRRLPPHAAAVDFRPVLGRQPSRSRGGHLAHRGRPLLVETHEDRSAGRTVLSGADPVLLLHPSAAGAPAGLRAGHQRLLGAQAGGHRVLPQPVHRGPAPSTPTFIDNLRNQAATWGWSIGVRYGEPSASREPIGLKSLQNLS